MFKLIGKVLFLFLIATTIYAYNDSKNTFQAKFQNIDGLPKGAPVTALGVKIGYVVDSKASDDGLVVLIKITNKSFAKPPAGSRLTITSFRPGQGRNLEIIPPENLNGNTAWLIEEPISAESWLHASFEILEGVKDFSETTISYLTPENINKIRNGIENSANKLETITENLKTYEENIIAIQKKLSIKAEQARYLLHTFKSSVQSLNEILKDENYKKTFSKGTKDFSTNLNRISDSIKKPGFADNIHNFKSEVIDSLNEINNYFIEANENIKDLELKRKVQDFNDHIKNLNNFYENLNQTPLEENIKETLMSSKENTNSSSEITKKILNKI